MTASLTVIPANLRATPVQLVIESLGKRYPGRGWALSELTLTLTPGVTGLLGPNGAGESTLMRILATITRPSAGRVLWNGRDRVALARQRGGRLGHRHGVSQRRALRDRYIHECGRRRGSRDRTLAEHGASLFVGGAFSLAGGRPAYGLAEWRDELPPAGVRSVSAAPNPSAADVHVRHDLAAPTRVRIQIFDLAGNRVDQLIDGHQSSGPQDVVWHAHASRARPGIYFARISLAGETRVMRVVLIR